MVATVVSGMERSSTAAKLFLAAALGMLLAFACGFTGEPESEKTPLHRARATPKVAATAIPTATPRPTERPRPRPTRAALVVPSFGAAASPTPRPVVAPTPLPVTIVALAVTTRDEARNLVWVHLSRCAPLDPSQLNAYQVKKDWFVKAPTTAPIQFGVWKVDAKSGDLTPHDILAGEWQPYIDSGCNAELGQSLLPATPAPTQVPTPTPTPTPRPTLTPTPMPTATPIVPNTGEAVDSIWSYLVKCFPDAERNELVAVLDPVTDEYVVKDKDEIQYGVWRVDRDSGTIAPDNQWAQGRNQLIQSGTC